MSGFPNKKDYKKIIPRPIYEEHPEYTELYDKAWALAAEHIKSIPGMPQDPYMDEAFCDTQIWIWDTCFMALFCKYARDIFPGVESLKNFYEVLYGEKRLPAVIPTDREPDWTGATPGEPYEIAIHIADNPPLFAWAEYENALMRADKDAIRSLLYEKRFLQKHYFFIEDLKKPTKPYGVFNETCLVTCDCGYLWEGGRSGMDNTPRGRIGEHAVGQRPNNPDMLWLDAICQQALSASMIARLFSLIGDGESAAVWQNRFEEKKTLVNTLYWDDEDGFYYDIDQRDHRFYKVKTLASYWTMTARIAPRERAERLLSYLTDEKHFFGRVAFPALSRSDSDFKENGEYWRGGVWLPTAYATLTGMKGYGYFDEAREMAKSLLSHMYLTYKEYSPHTVWECYSPTEHAPANIETGEKKNARADFCGWSALGPISVFIEFILGFHTADAFENTLYWAMPKDIKGRLGIENYRFGSTVTTVTYDGSAVQVKANRPFTLVINGKPYEIKEGENEIRVVA